MEGLRIEDLQRALQTRDPSLVDMVVSLAGQGDPYYDDLPDGAFTIHEFRTEIRSWGFRYKEPEEQFAVRTEGWKRLESEDADKPLPDRYQIHEIVQALHESDGAYARETLLEVIRKAPIRLGVWRGLKRLMKETEESRDLELYGALLARIDSELSKTWADGEITRGTLMYLSRRGWRFLSQLGGSFPAAYVETVVAVLREYPESTEWNRTWVANHVMFHNYKVYGGKCYSTSGFSLWQAPDSLVKYRAYSDLWTVDSRPLFGLLERAHSERARSFAIEGLKSDFKASLRELDIDQILRLIQVNSSTVQNFAVWLLENAPRFEQASFRELGLHAAVLSLLDSGSGEARKYAAKYARTHARDMSVPDILRIANHHDDTVRKLAYDLLKDLDPKKDVGLEAWGQLLGSSRAHKLAVDMLNKHFDASDLTLDWFFARFIDDVDDVFEFAIDRFAEVHAIEKVDPSYFVKLIETENVSYETTAFAIESLEQFDAKKLDIDIFRRLLLHESVTDEVEGWISQEIVDPVAMGVDYWRALSYRPTWESFDWAKKLITDGPKWARDYSPFGSHIPNLARETLGDVRNFSPGDIGFEWLMDIVANGDESAREWAMEYMFEAFAPAEFADSVGGDDDGGEADLGQNTFLFTGKLATMTRKEAQGKVADANGKKGSSVTKNLDYLVIGDEGSPFYEGGSKGSKQKKADSLNDAGAGINIISETAFLQMLSGGRKEYGEADMVAGCETLWLMAMGPDAQDGPVETFARQYLRRHHDVVGQKLTDKTVEESRKLPDSFLTFERFKPLFTDKRGTARNFALEIARYEMARWSPPLPEIVALCESRRSPVRRLFSDALLADDTKENERLRIAPESMDAPGVYSFCESLDRGTRSIGMLLIDRYPQFAEPKSLFRLTESPDRRIQAFVVKVIWRLYRDAGTTADWAPRELDAKYTARSDRRFEQGPGVQPRPEAPPAEVEELRVFMRRTLFGLPPARPPRGEEREEGEPRPLPAGRAKIFLLETMRDLAVEDQAFAGVIRPLLVEFARTLGQRERGACLVALARIDHRWEVGND